MSNSTLRSTHVTMQPSAYEGAEKTCFVGRIVMIRGPFEIPRRTQEANGVASGKQSKGKPRKGNKKGSATQQEKLMKMEIHFQGGQGLEDVLYAEAWEDLDRLEKELEDKKVYRVSGVRYVAQQPKFSTSILTYHVKLGKKTVVEEVGEKEYMELPKHHPFTTIAKLTSVTAQKQLCLKGIVSKQPGVVEKETKYGRKEVCNAVVKQGEHDIRLAFWGAAANELSQLPVGQAAEFLQVSVVRVEDGSWEVRATEATQINVVTDSDLEASTDVNTAGQSLTNHGHSSVDYDTVQTLPYTVSALSACIVPGIVRELPGVYEVHNVAILGFSAVGSSDTFFLNCCKECKRQVDATSGKCLEHEGADVVQRWAFLMEVADRSGSVQAIAFHESLGKVPFLPKEEPCDKILLRMRRLFKGTCWSGRFVFKTNSYKNENSLEIKRLAPTCTEEGVINTFKAKVYHLAPQVSASGKCPCAVCASVTLDSDFGTMRVGVIEAVAIRVLVHIEALADEEDTTIIDSNKQGLQVTRRAKCGVNVEDKTTYWVRALGTSAQVQWLNQSSGESFFFITAKLMREEDGRKIFQVLGFLDVSKMVADFRAFLEQILEAASAPPPMMSFSPGHATPGKRNRQMNEGLSIEEDDFSKRTRHA